MLRSIYRPRLSPVEDGPESPSAPRQQLDVAHGIRGEEERALPGRGRDCPAVGQQTRWGLRGPRGWRGGHGGRPPGFGVREVDAEGLVGGVGDEDPALGGRPDRHGAPGQSVVDGRGGRRQVDGHLHYGAQVVLEQQGDARRPVLVTPRHELGVQGSPLRRRRHLLRRGNLVQTPVILRWSGEVRASTA